MGSKKYYWLKLKRDFFKRHDISIIEGMPNGKDYVLFYLKLLVESIDHEGMLRFSDTIPYTEQMLATITNTNVDVAKSAMNIFVQLNLITITEDQTICMNEVPKMLGFETDWARQKREFREKSRTLSAECPPIVRQEKELELDIESIKKEILKKESVTKFVKPSEEEVAGYIREKGYHFDAESFVAFYESKGWKVGNQPMKNWKACCTTWEKRKTTNGSVKKGPNFEQRTNDIDSDVMDRFNKLVD